MLAALTLSVVLGQTPFVLRNGASTPPGYQGEEDVNIAETPTTGVYWQPDVNYSAAGENLVDGWPSDVSTLLRCDLAPTLAPGSVINSVELSLSVTNSTVNNYPMYALLVGWTDSQATWNQRQTGVPWNIAGALAAGLDCAAAPSVTLSPTGPARLTLVLNAEGVARVQDWVDNPTRNFGFIFQNPGAGDAVNFAATEDATVSNRPQLHVLFNGGSVADFQNGLLPSTAYAGCTDTLIAHGANIAANLDMGGLRVAGGTGSPARALLRFDLSLFPAGTVIHDAGIELNVEFDGNAMFNLHRLRVPWTEAGADWATRDGVTPWSVDGGRAGVDYDTAPFDTLAGLSLGVNRVALGPGGVAALQAWVDDPTSNRGFIIVPSNDGSGVSLILSDAEHTHVPFRPGLFVEATVPPGADAGTDAGTPPGTDAGLASERHYDVRCGCGARSGAAAPGCVCLLVLLRRRRPRPHGVSS